jgi:hypothetical protein
VEFSGLQDYSGEAVSGRGHPDVIGFKIGVIKAFGDLEALASLEGFDPGFDLGYSGRGCFASFLPEVILEDKNGEVKFGVRFFGFHGFSSGWLKAEKRDA